MVSLYVVPVLFLFASGEIMLPFSMYLPENVVACVAHVHTLNYPPSKPMVHFTCYKESGEAIAITKSGVYKA